VPTKGAHIARSAVGADGALWFTSRCETKLGRRASEDGRVQREYPLTDKNSGAATVEWRIGGEYLGFTANFGGYMGK